MENKKCLKPPTRFILETNGKTMDKNDEKMETIGKNMNKHGKQWKTMEHFGKPIQQLQNPIDTNQFGNAWTTRKSKDNLNTKIS